MAKSDKRRLREVRYTDKRRLRGVVYLPGPQRYMRYAEVLINTYNEAGKRVCETPDRTFYDAIIVDQRQNLAPFQRCLTAKLTIIAHVAGRI